MGNDRARLHGVVRHATRQHVDRERHECGTLGYQYAGKGSRRHRRQGLEYDTLVRRDTIRVECQRSKNYDVGNVIQPERNYSREGLRRGETYRVVENGPGNQLTVTSRDGQRIEFSPMRASNLSVYTAERSEFAPGDRMRVTRNDPDLDVANGDRFVVAAVAADKIELTRADRHLILPVNGSVHLDYAHVTTVHSSQGLTADLVLYEADSHSLTTRKEVFYVAVSRANTPRSTPTTERCCPKLSRRA